MEDVKPLAGYGTIRSTAYTLSAVEALRWEKQYRDWHADDDMDLDPKYLAWIRTLPCSVRGCACRDVEAAHVGARGYGQRCHDKEAIPLCGIRHHREGPASVHKLQKLFWAFHGIDRGALIAQLNARYEVEVLGRAA